uniref:Chemokine interleukin-8-like domain-containing protein n=1 Tax=Cyprinus carpio TaxID=7962 RepID=A0A8C1VTD7_CYPCA
MKFILFTAILFSIWWIFGGPPIPCCYTVRTIMIPAANIVDYCIQEPVLCPIRAVRFQTKKYKVICLDPDSKRAKKLMEIVDRRKTTTTPSQKPTTCYTSTTNVNPTVTTRNKTPGTETETSMRRPDCCTTVTNIRLQVENIVYYDMQETNLCPVRAVRFHTNKNIIICSDTDSLWAKRAKAIVDERMTIKTSGLKTKISKTNIQPTSVSKDNPESSLSTVTCKIGETVTCGLVVDEFFFFLERDFYILTII